MAERNEFIRTSMIWGSLWDETLQWLLETEAQIQYGENGTRTIIITEYDINTDSTNWENYKNATFEYTMTDEETSTKNSGSSINLEMIEYLHTI